MTACSLYGRLAAELTMDYQHKSELFRRHSHLINQFGELLKPFRLNPHVRPDKETDIGLVAVSDRGEDAEALRQALAAAGAVIGEASRLPQQFDDGYLMSTAPVRMGAISFTLLFYTKRPAA
jgi:hypothetical protein